MPVPGPVISALVAPPAPLVTVPPPFRATMREGAERLERAEIDHGPGGSGDQDRVAGGADDQPGGRAALAVGDPAAVTEKDPDRSRL